MPRYLLHIDDSGNKEYAGPNEAYGRTGKSRYFVFGGLLAEEGVSATLASRIADLKRATFGTPDVEIKSNWLRMPPERQRRYLDPFGVTDADLEQFVSEFYGAIGEADLQLIAAVVDKVHMREEYGEKAYYPPAVAYEFLLQRVAQTLTPPHSVSVVVDDMSGKTPNGSPYKSNLLAQHSQLCKHGSRLMPSLNFGALEPRLRFVNSAKSHAVQVADVVAYNVYRQFCDHGEAWEDAASRLLPTYEWFKRLSPKFRQHMGRIQGFGVVKAPLRRRVPWSVR